MSCILAQKARDSFFSVKGVGKLVVGRRTIKRENGNRYSYYDSVTRRPTQRCEGRSFVSLHRRLTYTHGVDTGCTQAGRQSSRCGSISAQLGRLADALHLTPRATSSSFRHCAAGGRGCLSPPSPPTTAPSSPCPLDASALGSAGPEGGTQCWNCLDNTRSALGPLSPGAVRTNQLSPGVPGFIHPLLQPRASRGSMRERERETGAEQVRRSQDRQLPVLGGMMRLSVDVDEDFACSGAPLPL